eukprot:1158458-Pelagomonas_calceolata.AAC.10
MQSGSNHKVCSLITDTCQACNQKVCHQEVQQPLLKCGRQRAAIHKIKWSCNKHASPRPICVKAIVCFTPTKFT